MINGVIDAPGLPLSARRERGGYPGDNQRAGNAADRGKTKWICDSYYCAAPKTLLPPGLLEAPASAKP